MSEKTTHSQNKKGLGRGLGSLLGAALVDEEEAPTKKHPASSAAEPAPTMSSNNVSTASDLHRPSIAEESQIWMIPVDRLAPNTQQPRQIFSPEALKDLTASIKEKGILQPIVARRLGERQFEIIAGERRWRAAQAAGLHEVPVILKKVSEQDSLEFAIIENIQRENLNPMEEAEALENLLNEYGLTQQEVADKLGKERSTIANSLRLISLAPEVKMYIRNGQLSAGHAKVILGVEGATNQQQIAKQAVNQKLSVRATEKLVAQNKLTAKAKSGSAINVDISQRLIDGLSDELQKLLGTKISIDYANGKGKLSIHFYSDDQLSQTVERLRKAWAK
ncbi:MAG: ParB/RepB/Spo0J family partition protein [Bdellovibrionota bacterium]